MNRIERFKKDVEAKRAIKVISGIDNFDIDKVKKVVAAAEQAGASAVDVACSEEIVKVSKEITSLPVFVSSIDPQELAHAAEWGADAIEIGNFDALYKNGVRMSAEEIHSIAKRTFELLNGREIYVSATVPGHIEVGEQIWLASELEKMGVNIIQTEGAAMMTSSQIQGAKGLMELAQQSIANTIELSRNISIPVMTASGLTTTTAPMAFAAGASAIGVGSCINKLNTTIEMVAVIRTLVEQCAQREMNRDMIHA